MLWLRSRSQEISRTDVLLGVGKTLMLAMPRCFSVACLIDRLTVEVSNLESLYESCKAQWR